MAFVSYVNKNPTAPIFDRFTLEIDAKAADVSDPAYCVYTPLDVEFTGGPIFYSVETFPEHGYGANELSLTIPFKYQHNILNVPALQDIC
jgi:hypothetical protein